jgi:hypothetical protein
MSFVLIGQQLTALNMETNLRVFSTVSWLAVDEFSYRFISGPYTHSLDVL